MLSRLAEKLFAREPLPEAPQKTGTTALAVCVVMMEAANADDTFTEEERTHILDVLQKRFDLPKDEAHELLEEAAQARKASSDLWHFTHEINRAFSVPEKIRVMEELWRIFYSDQFLDGHEDHLAHQLAELLNLNHRQFIDAKLKVLKEVRGE